MFSVTYSSCNQKDIVIGTTGFGILDTRWMQMRGVHLLEVLNIIIISTVYNFLLLWTGGKWPLTIYGFHIVPVIFNWSDLGQNLFIKTLSKRWVYSYSSRLLSNGVTHLNLKVGGLLVQTLRYRKGVLIQTLRDKGEGHSYLR